MHRSAILFLTMPAILAAQPAGLDEGRLDPAWFGSAAVFQPSKSLGFQWLKPGLDLRNRTLQLRAWEAPVWVKGRREMKDQTFLRRVEGTLPKRLDRGLRRGLKGSVPVSAEAGEVHLVGRIVDAIGQADDYMAAGRVALSFDLKLVDGKTGELLGAFHDTLESGGADYIAGRFERWCEDLGRLLSIPAAPKAATAFVPPPATPPAPPAPAAAKPGSTATPAFDLESALSRIEGLRRDGLLSEEEYQALRKKAAEKAGSR